MTARLRAPAAFLVPLALSGCCTPPSALASADGQVYGILEATAAHVTGERKRVDVVRPVDTLRTRLLETREPVQISLAEALEVAAENSREFQRQKEQLYLAALTLTRRQRDFQVIFGALLSAAVEGIGDDSVDVALRDDLSASVNSTAGTRVVLDFVNTFLRSVLSGGGFDGSSILGLTITQPLLARGGARIVREPLTQSERDVVYAMRTFERFRATFAVRVVSEYWRVAALVANLRNVEANYRSLVQSREQIEELYNAGRRTVTDLGRAKQSEYSADAQRVTAANQLQTQLDRFKLTLGLPVTARVDLVPEELDKVADRVVETLDLTEDLAVALALQRRYDFRTVVDQVEDAGRRILVAEDALGLGLDFTGALDVPPESGRGLNLDWSRINWSAGFRLDLALDRVAERNAYRGALIDFEFAVRQREQNEDQIASDVRGSLRDIQAALDSYRIQSVAVELAAQRVEATTDLYAAGRVQALEKLDAQDALLRAQLDLTQATVNYAIARLELMSDLEAISLEPQGLRFDPALPLPQPKTAE
ncbi:MAG: TolC family protein [Planctomycetes bacterium]|nr:TolC family protein [Planctomycetota bacterium]